MKKIPLTKGFSTIVDDNDYETFSKYKWYASGKAPNVYAARTVRIGDRKLNKKKIIYLHREILKAKPNKIVDHINCDRLDNRKENLRLCSYTENQRNRSRTKYKKDTKYKGVFKESRSVIWYAGIVIDGKLIRSSGFKTDRDAAKEYDKLALKYFGEFAKLNFEKRRK